VDLDEYVAARYGRLIEHAVGLGCSEDEARGYVDQALLEQRREIRRAEDPDPLVQEALERAISGAPPHRRSRAPFVAVGLVAVAVTVAVVLTYQPAPQPMPSLFAMNRAQAERLLEGRGYDVVFQPLLACEPLGLVMGSEPTPGTPVRDGAKVTVSTAAPSDALCEAGRTARSDAWQFVGFVRGGPAPEFADQVDVTVDNGSAVTLTHDDVVDTDRWGEAIETIIDTVGSPAPTPSGMPRLLASEVLPEPWCGDAPLDESDREILRIVLDTRALGNEGGCPMTIDLYRDDRHVINAVGVHTPRDLDEDFAEG
jgi:hypothetical protein